MNVRTEILKYLEPGQATAAALADSLKVSPEKIRYQLQRLLAEDLITEHPIAASRTCPKGPITVYRLSYAYRSSTTTHPTAAAS
jgi:predicted ArsR family transcriptional regulator